MYEVFIVLAIVAVVIFLGAQALEMYKDAVNGNHPSDDDAEDERDEPHHEGILDIFGL